MMIRRVLLGPLNTKWNKLPDINTREMITLVPLMIFILAFGLYPSALLHYMVPTLQALLTRVGGAV